MDQKSADEAATLLLQTRKGGAPLAEFPASCQPRSFADAYAIQTAVTKGLGATIGGWKIGAPGGGDPPFCAPIYTHMIRPSPATYTKDELQLVGIEAEIAFRFKSALPKRAAPYTREEATADVTCHPAIEVVDTRFQQLKGLAKLAMLADCYANAGLVYGREVANWRDLDMVRPAITVTEDGKPFAETVENPARDPVGALTDFVNLMRERDGTQAGTIVTTGSCTGLVFSRHGVRIAADFGPFGRLEIGFPG